MFTVYGKAGRTFRGSLEELLLIGPITRATRAHAVAAIGEAPKDRHPSQYADLMPTVPPPEPVDLSHRTALAAYKQTRNLGLPRQPLTGVDAVMSSDVVTLAETSTVEQAWPESGIRRVASVLLDSGLPGLPVVDDEGALSALCRVPISCALSWQTRR